MKKYSVIVFDMGDVMASGAWEQIVYERSNSIAGVFGIDVEWAKEAGRASYKEYDRITVGDSLDAQWRMYWQSFIEKLPVVPDGLSVDWIMSHMDEHFVLLDNDKWPCLLRQLRERGYVLAICSNNTDFYFDKIWKMLDYKEFFEERNIILSQNVGATKSSIDHEMFKALKDATQKDYDQMIFFDDRQHNIDRANGLEITGLTVPRDTKEVFNFIQKSLEDLLGEKFQKS